jgi:hypothetical protein
VSQVGGIRHSNALITLCAGELREGRHNVVPDDVERLVALSRSIVQWVSTALAKSLICPKDRCPTAPTGDAGGGRELRAGDACLSDPAFGEELQS